jgi:hypothetical protein
MRDLIAARVELAIRRCVGQPGCTIEKFAIDVTDTARSTVYDYLAANIGTELVEELCRARRILDASGVDPAWLLGFDVPETGENLSDLADSDTPRLVVDSVA